MAENCVQLGVKGTLPTLLGNAYSALHGVTAVPCTVLQQKGARRDKTATPVKGKQQQEAIIITNILQEEYQNYPPVHFQLKDRQ